MVAAGSMDKRVTFQRASAGENSLGEEVIGPWADICTRWAQVSYGTGAERREAAAEEATMTITVTTHRDEATLAVTPANRIVFDGHTYNITSIADLPGNVARQFTATTRFEAP